ncbi:MAG TPA: PHB depolymerase family esterase [Acidimicrobiia bacterium]|nr:PHB depolymerase family esterase [Acidimicrobiia bacterium]
MIARRRRRLLSAAFAVALLAGACSGSSSQGSAPTSARSAPTTGPRAASCAPARPHAPGQSGQAFDFGGTQRTYQLYVPSAYAGTTAVPVVFDFHGFGSNAQQQIVYGNFEPLANRHDFIVVAPDGQGAIKHFNLTGEKGKPSDIAMVLALVKHIEATFCVDTARVYSTGMSDGGAMTSILACVAPQTFAAFGPVAVQLAPPGCNNHSVAMIAFHGTKDPVVPYAGGKVNCCGGAILGSTPKAMASWAAHDHCNAAFTDTKLGTQVSRRAWKGCEGTSEVVLYSIIGGGHTWPGAIAIPRLGLTTKQIDASSTIWDFFAAHPLTSG